MFNIHSSSTVFQDITQKRERVFHHIIILTSLLNALYNTRRYRKCPKTTGIKFHSQYVFSRCNPIFQKSSDQLRSQSLASLRVVFGSLRLLRLNFENLRTYIFKSSSKPFRNFGKPQVRQSLIPGSPSASRVPLATFSYF